MNELIRTNQIDFFFNHIPENSRITYIKAINQFLDFFNIGINQLDTITPENIMKYITALKAKYANSTINVKLASLKTLYNKLSVLQAIQNPFDILKKLKIKTSYKTKKSISKEKVLSEIEVYKILEYLKNKPSKVSSRNYCLVRLLYETGLRISEALSIRFEDIHPNNSGSYTVGVTGKEHKQREIYILPNLYKSIETICENKEGYIFLSSCGKHLKRTALIKTFKKLGNLIGKNISPHTFRHSFITNMVENNPAKLKAISTYAGHSNVNTTLMMYVHNEVTPNDIKNIAIG